MPVFPSPSRRPSRRPVCITIGNFDGVHLGHQALLDQTKKIARTSGLDFLAVTFWPHPGHVLNPTRQTPLLSSRDEKLTLLKSLGAVEILEIPFDRHVASLSPEDFIFHWLLPLNIKHIVIGHDFHFGHDRSGTLDVLKILGMEHDFFVTQTLPFIVDGQPVSSSRIRSEIQLGRMKSAATLLGRPYSLTGTVAHGFARGRELGFPTANILPALELMPPNGVYATRVHHSGKVSPAVTNIGSNPTFNASETTIESHLLDRDENLYHQKIRVEFVEKLREEKKFSSAEELRSQIAIDIANAENILL